MLLQPRWGEAPKIANGAIEMLLECHERIRRFSALAVKLAATEAIPPAQVADAANQLVRYFGTALPLHVLDEDVTLGPILGKDVRLAQVVATLSQQHRELEAALERLLVTWRTLAEQPEGPRAALIEPSRWLSDHFDAHLRLEETELFPVARSLLSPEVDQAVVAELRGRRQPAR